MVLTLAVSVAACASGARRIVEHPLVDGPEVLYNPDGLTEAMRLDEEALAKAGRDPLYAVTERIEMSREREEWLEGEYWINQVKLNRTRDFAIWFEPRAHTFPPLWIYAAARKMEAAGNSVKAAFWYIVARERHVRHLRRCRDHTAVWQLTWADAAFARLRIEMQRSPELTRYAAKHGFAWLDLHRDTEMGLIESCTWGEKGLARVSQGTMARLERAGGTVFKLIPPPINNPADWIVPENEIHEIRIWSRIMMKQEVAKLLGEPEQVPPTATVTPLR
ncbi:MAG: hypothetical protein VW268_09135 [Rhodospirillaceae bacterium]